MVAEAKVFQEDRHRESGYPLVRQSGEGLGKRVGSAGVENEHQEKAAGLEAGSCLGGSRGSISFDFGKSP